MTKKVQIPFIPNDAIVKVDISGYFYKKLQTVLIGLGNQKSAEDFKAVLEKLKTDESPSDVYEAQVHVITALVISIEKSAMEQKVIEYHEHEIEESANN